MSSIPPSALDDRTPSPSDVTPASPSQRGIGAASWPLERTLALWASLLFAVVLGIVLAVSTYAIRSRAEQLQSSTLNRAAMRTAQLFEAYVRQQARGLATVSRMPTIAAAFAAGAPSAVADSASSLLRQVMTRRDTTVVVGLWRANGEFIAGSGVTSASTAALRRDGFFTPLERSASDSMHVGSIALRDGIPRNWLSVPVRDANGVVIGMLAMERRIEAPQSQLARINEFLGADRVPLLRNVGAPLWFSIAGDTLSAPTDVDSTDEITSYQRGREKMLAGAAVVGGTPWSVVIETPYETAMAGAQRDARLLVLVALALGALSVLLLWRLGRRAARPLATLAVAADAIAEGNYGSRTSVMGTSEVERLGAAFNTMASRLESNESTRRFLEDARALLADSLADEKALRALTELCVPRMADWCSLHLVADTGGLDRAETSHRDTAKASLLREMLERYPYRMEDEEGPPAVIRHQVAAFQPIVDAAAAERFARDDVHREMIRALAPRSYIGVPLLARGRVLGAMSFVMSDSGRHYSEDDLAMARELARRTAIAIDNTRLYRAAVQLRMDAEAASRAKSDFLATMSHEIRTPINAMVGYAELMEMGVNGPLNERQRESVARIRSSGAHLTSLVEDILDLSKIEARQLELTAVPVLASETVDRAVALIQPQARAKSVALLADMTTTVGVRYFGDPRRVQQILTNLLSNAVKFTASTGQVRVTCGVGPRPATEQDDDSLHGAAAFISVSDTGIGMAAEDLDRIFQPFVQLHTGYTRLQGGTGLGLAICKSLAEMMSGALTVESKVGVGSTFTLWLPLASGGQARGSGSARTGVKRAGA